MYTLQQSINWASAYIYGMPVTAWTNNEPAISVASMIRATILSPPFSWAFNRVSNDTLQLSKGQQDYPVALTDFGYLEKLSLFDGSVSWEVSKVWNVTPLVSTQGVQARPDGVSVQQQIPGANITLRFSAVPDKTYPVDFDYQQSANLFSSLSDTWNPLPDNFIPIFNNLFLGEMLADADDQRAQIYRQRGVASLLARAEGLSEAEKSVFAQSYLQQSANMIIPQMKVQQGISARGV